MQLINHPGRRTLNYNARPPAAASCRPELLLPRGETATFVPQIDTHEATSVGFSPALSHIGVGQGQSVAARGWHTAARRAEKALLNGTIILFVVSVMELA
jgi:hypothetical protein